jgi:hypothetical protein
VRVVERVWLRRGSSCGGPKLALRSQVDPKGVGKINDASRQTLRLGHHCVFVGVILIIFRSVHPIPSDALTTLGGPPSPFPLVTLMESMRVSSNKGVRVWERSRRALGDGADEDES